MNNTITLSRNRIYNKMASLHTLYRQQFEKYVENERAERALLDSYKTYGKFEMLAELCGMDTNSIVVGKQECDICYCPQTKEYILFVENKLYETIPYKQFNIDLIRKKVKKQAAEVVHVRTQEQVRKDLTRLAHLHRSNDANLEKAELDKYYKPLIEKLTGRQRQVVDLRVAGNTLDKIIAKLDIERKYGQAIFRKATARLAELSEEYGE